MPELPEVEIIKRELKKEVLNLRVTKIYQSFLTLRGKEQPDLTPLINQSILNIHRRNKYLILELTNHFLVIHLGMTGSLIYDDLNSFESISKKKHVHISMLLSKGILYYHDIRRFGALFLYKKNNLNFLDLSLFSNLGIEPLSNEFTIEKLKEKILNSTENSKQFLMNGNNICGIGNIYANEILFLSQINPLIKIKSLKDKEIKILYNHIVNVLKKAIELGGSSISDFVHLNGKTGNMQKFYNVYSREKQSCFNCGSIIIKIKQNGRSTFYCPKCQKEEN